MDADILITSFGKVIDIIEVESEGEAFNVRVVGRDCELRFCLSREQLRRLACCAIRGLKGEPQGWFAGTKFRIGLGDAQQVFSAGEVLGQYAAVLK